jgi:DMSO/TMAO reductase YedYZ heme-binding membrane subunit
MSNTNNELPEEHLWQPITVKWFFVVFGLSLFYAIIRYHLAAEIPWQHISLFILNKATSLSAVVFISCSYLIGKLIRWHDHDKQLRLIVVKFCGLVGFFLAGIHAFMSVLLMKPAYFEKYFQADGRMNWMGELGMAAGIVALFLLMSPAVTSLSIMSKAIGGKRWKRSQRLGYYSLLLVIIHVFVLGFNGWLAPQKWPAGLIPISLVAFVVALLPLMVKRKLIAENRDKVRKSAV